MTLRRCGGPCLPADIRGANHLAGGEVVFGDQDIHGSKWRRGHLFGRRLRRPRPARQPRCRAAGGKSDTEYDETRGFHYAFHFPGDTAAGAAVVTGFQELNVKAWLMRRI